MIIVCILISFIFGICIVKIFNAFPDKWLCDYDGTTVTGKNPNNTKGVRLKYLPWIFLISPTLLVFLLSNVALKGGDGGRVTYILLSFAILVVLLIIGISDIMYMIIPDQCVFMLLAIGGLTLIVNIFFTKDSGEGAGNLEYYIAGALIGSLVYAIPCIAGSMFRKEQAVGLGDVKLMCALGFSVGVIGIISIFLYTALLSGVFAISCIAYNYFKEKEVKMLPLAPFIVTGYILFFIWQ